MAGGSYLERAQPRPELKGSRSRPQGRSELEAGRWLQRGRGGRGSGDRAESNTLGKRELIYWAPIKCMTFCQSLKTESPQIQSRPPTRLL